LHGTPSFSDRTEGNPFFLEESVRTLVEMKALVGERGAYRLSKPIETIEVPSTVQAVLAARIDRLSPEDKLLLQSASVIGETIPLTLLQAVMEIPEEELRRGLSQLQAAEFLYETSLFPDVEYTFKHGLTYQVAYNSLLVDRRRTLHSRIVQVIEGVYGDHLSEHVEQLAHHAFRGELWKKAASYLHQAGTKAAARSAYRETLVYLDQALAALRHLPESPETIEQAIAIRLDLGTALFATKGHSAPEAKENYIQARELCERLGETPQLFPVLWGLTRTYDFGGEPQKAQELGEKLFSLARHAQDPALLLEAHHTEWARSLTLGELSSGLIHIERGIELYKPQQHT
jgi:predicted ATPase